MNGHAGYSLTTLLPFAVVIIVLALRFRSMSRERLLNHRTLWIGPLVYLLIVASTLFVLPPSPRGWSLTGIALIIGLVLGWYRGRLIHIDRNLDTSQLRQKASPLAMIFIVALVALKLGARSIFGDLATTQPGSGAMLLTDAFIGFALGLLTATRIELYLRARQIFVAE